MKSHQISLPYSAIVRSELNFPLVATFKIAICAHKLVFCKEIKMAHVNDMRIVVRIVS